jgi:hypothetical protein
VQDELREHVVGLGLQLFVGEPNREGVNLRRTDEKRNYGSDDFKEPENALGRDADHKGAVQQLGFAGDPPHWAMPLRW